MAASVVLGRVLSGLLTFEFRLDPVDLAATQPGGAGLASGMKWSSRQSKAIWTNSS